jgi:hypothetical protein
MTKARGERHGMARLTAQDVLRIRSLPYGEEITAELFGVHRSTIGYIRRGRTWRRLHTGDEREGVTDER